MSTNMIRTVSPICGEGLECGPILQFAGTDRSGGSPEISGLSPFHGVATNLKRSGSDGDRLEEMIDIAPIQAGRLWGNLLNWEGRWVADSKLG